MAGRPKKYHRSYLTLMKTTGKCWRMSSATICVCHGTIISIYRSACIIWNASDQTIALLIFSL